MELFRRKVGCVGEIGVFFCAFRDCERAPAEGLETMLRILREGARVELERKVRPFRRARNNSRPREGWLRAMRLATGIPAERIATAVGTSRAMVFRSERAELKETITLAKLGRMARAVECDLVYGLVPWHRSLGDRAMELIEEELRRKRYTGKKAVSSGQ